MKLMEEIAKKKNLEFYKKIDEKDFNMYVYLKRKDGTIAFKTRLEGLIDYQTLVGKTTLKTFLEFIV